MCESDENEFAEAIYPRTRSFVHYDQLAGRVGHNPKHKQRPIVINGAWTTVDEKIYPLVRSLNRLGWTTRYSCQSDGLKGKREVYIMFEGEIAIDGIQRQMFSLDGVEFFGDLDEDGRAIYLDLMDRFYGAEWVEQFGRRTHVLLPGRNTADDRKWTISKGHRVGARNHLNTGTITLRFPKKDLTLFTELIEMLEKALDKKERR